MRLSGVFITLFLISLMSVVCVFAGGWKQEAGFSSYITSSISAHGASSLYQYNYNTDTNYKKCVIAAGSRFEPVWFNDPISGVPLIAISTVSGIDIYDVFCQFKDNVYEVPSLAPTITDLDQDSYFELTFVTGMNRIVSYEYTTNYSYPVFTRIADYTLPYAPTGGFACGSVSVSHDINLPKKCFVFAAEDYYNVNQNIYFNFSVIDFSAISAPTISTYTQTLPLSGMGWIIAPAFNYSYSDISVSIDNAQSYAYIPVYLAAISDASGRYYTQFIVFRSDGSYYTRWNTTLNQGSLLMASTGDHYTNVITSRLGLVNVRGTDILLVEGTAAAPGDPSRIARIVKDTYGLSGGLLKYFFDYAGASISSFRSNLMVGDYDKDGMNELCQVELVNPNGITPAQRGLVCYDSTGNVISAYNYSGTGVNDFFNNETMSYVMGDFCGAGNMGIASSLGIFCSNDNTTGAVNLLNDTGYLQSTLCSSQVSHTTGYTACNPGSASYFLETGTPIYAFAADSFTVLYRSIVNLSICGNGICTSGFENEFTCPTDCNSSTRIIIPNPDTVGYIICYDDSDCVNPLYPKCVYKGTYTEGNREGQCVSGYNASITCTNSGQCPANLPICFLNYCVSGVNGGVYPPFINESLPSGSTPQTDIKTSVESFFDVILGGSPYLKLFTSIILIGLVVFGAYGTLAKFSPNSSPSVLIPLLMGFLCLVVLTMVGMMPVAILIILVLGSVGIFSLSIMLKPGQV